MMQIDLNHSIFFSPMTAKRMNGIILASEKDEKPSESSKKIKNSNIIRYNADEIGTSDFYTTMNEWITTSSHFKLVKKSENGTGFEWTDEGIFLVQKYCEIINREREFHTKYLMNYFGRRLRTASTRASTYDAIARAMKQFKLQQTVEHAQKLTIKSLRNVYIRSGLIKQKFLAFVQVLEEEDVIETVDRDEQYRIKNDTEVKFKPQFIRFFEVMQSAFHSYIQRISQKSDKQIETEMKEKLQSMLKENPKLHGVFIVSREGLIIDQCSQQVDRDLSYIAAATAILQSTSERLYEYFKSMSDVKMTLCINGDQIIIVSPIGTDYVICIHAQSDITIEYLQNIVVSSAKIDPMITSRDGIAINAINEVFGFKDVYGDYISRTITMIMQSTAERIMMVINPQSREKTYFVTVAKYGTYMTVPNRRIQKLFEDDTEDFIASVVITEYPSLQKRIEENLKAIETRKAKIKEINTENGSKTMNELAKNEIITREEEITSYLRDNCRLNDLMKLYTFITRWTFTFDEFFTTNST